MRPVLWSSVLFIAAVCAACGGGSAADPSAPPPALSTQELDLAYRVAEMQMLNGAWGWQHAWDEPMDYEASGFQNVTGVSALGLFDAYEKDQASGAPQAPWIPEVLEDAKDYLIGVMSALDGTVATNCSLPNWVFMARYRDLFGLTPQEDAIFETGWDLFLDSRDAANGTDPSVRLDGIFNRIQTGRTGQGLPGIVGWDCAFVLKAGLALGEPANEIAWVRDALKALPVDTAATYGLDSAAHVLEALNLVGDTSMNAALVAAIEAEADPAGGYLGNNPESPFQTEAYVLMAYKQAGQPHAALEAYLETQVRPGGYVHGDDGIETCEVSGEVLLALVK